jgi:hypothetical protein
MKLIDKIKNYFCDEEEEAPKSAVQPKVEQANAKVKTEFREEKKENDDKPKTDVNAISERELFKSDPTFNFPIIFDEEDFKDEKINTSRIKPSKIEKNKVEIPIERERKIFKPSPIISPIYGVINIESKEKGNENNSSVDSLLNLYDENKKIDIDDVLGKAYPQTRVESMRENYTKPVDEPVIMKKDDAAYDFFNNITPDKEEKKPVVEVKDEAISVADEKLKSIDELLENTDDDDFYSLVDSMYKDNEEEGENQ